MAPTDSGHPKEFLTKGNQVNRQTSHTSCTSSYFPQKLSVS